MINDYSKLLKLIIENETVPLPRGRYHVQRVTRERSVGLSFSRQYKWEKEREREGERRGEEEEEEYRSEIFASRYFVSIYIDLSGHSTLLCNDVSLPLDASARRVKLSWGSVGAWNAITSIGYRVGEWTLLVLFILAL